ADLITRMRTRFPGITISVLELTGEDQWAALERADADIGLGVEPTKAFGALSSAMQYVHAIDHVAVAQSHELAGRETLSLGDLREYPMLALEPEVGHAYERVLAGVEAA